MKNKLITCKSRYAYCRRYYGCPSTYSKRQEKINKRLKIYEKTRKKNLLNLFNRYITYLETRNPTTPAEKSRLEFNRKKYEDEEIDRYFHRWLRFTEFLGNREENEPGFFFFTHKEWKAAMHAKAKELLATPSQRISTPMKMVLFQKLEKSCEYTEFTSLCLSLAVFDFSFYSTIYDLKWNLSHLLVDGGPKVKDWADGWWKKSHRIHYGAFETRKRQIILEHQIKFCISDSLYKELKEKNVWKHKTFNFLRKTPFFH